MTQASEPFKKVFLKTFGCQMNVADSETILSTLGPMGFEETPHAKDADLVVINTCSIREKAEHKLRSMVGRILEMKAMRPQMQIAIAGCMAQRAGDELAKHLPEVDIVFGPDQVAHLPAMIEEAQRSGKTVVNNSFEAEDLLFNPDHRTFQAKTSNFVPIMKGCDHKCTYCIVPFTRGIEKSRPLSSILAEVHHLVFEKQFKEVQLVGQNVNSYGRGSFFNFPMLLWRLAQVPGLKRIRFTTSHPKDCSQELANCFRDIPEVSPYLHLPVQSGSNSVLRRMRRGYTYEDYLKRIEMLKNAQPEIALSTDLIVGFPGETDQDFQQTLKLVRAVEYDFAYSFIYSPRPNTPAIRLHDSVPADEKKARLQELQALLKKHSIEKTQALVGTRQEILIEKLERNGDVLYGIGKTGTFKWVKAPVPLMTRLQDLVSVRVLSHDESRLYGESD
jgi:tRNA-2-methylthio-N6-dimethylallyladenosine synthase